ncbi:FAD binding domain-containing protein [Macrolepiota fuliginosa MF-IS2]|uniref:FAD binding domain-containing protein n=1 Tax=Macrolepiota fuliginosa MF-IS2 TaxID=1400762 RepID=A0A9P5XN43_9AGAR|nr:FAD binding domain-containing protein [Macrolepiota fuliginosa MF-IS2]
MSPTTETLSNHVNGDVLTPDHPEYTKSLHRWAINAEKRAAIIVFVKDEADVATAIAYAREQHLSIAICGGGHSPTGASSIAGGLVIDLSRYMNGVRVDPVEKLAYVGGGALWGTVDRTAIEYGLATVSGTVEHANRCGRVGDLQASFVVPNLRLASRLTLAGGFGWLCPEHGLVIDNLAQVTVVSADGVARRASETENPDLFFGIRGGGCNFGVVTEFVLRLHPQRRTVFAGSVTFTADKLESIVEATKAWFPGASPKEGVLMMPTCLPDGTPVVVLYIFVNGNEKEGRAKFKWIYDLEPFEDTAKEIPFELLNTIQNAITEHGNGVYWKGVTVAGPDYETTAKAHERIAQVAGDGRFTATAIYEWWPLQKVVSVPPENSVFHRIPRPNCLILIGWPGETNSEEKVDEARGYAHEIATLVAGGVNEVMDAKLRGYNNYDPEGIKDDKDEVKDKAKTNFGDHYPVLQKIKKKYDPENIFNKWLAIMPA